MPVTPKVRIESHFMHFPNSGSLLKLLHIHRSSSLSELISILSPSVSRLTQLCKFNTTRPLWCRTDGEYRSALHSPLDQGVSRLGVPERSGVCFRLGHDDRFKYFKFSRS
ncbi:hypothetical protein AAHE18_17G093800 [Arachis hypogaea]